MKVPTFFQPRPTPGREPSLPHSLHRLRLRLSQTVPGSSNHLAHHLKRRSEERQRRGSRDTWGKEPWKSGAIDSAIIDSKLPL